MSSSSRIAALESLLRERGLGRALPKQRKPDYPPVATAYPELNELLGGGFPRGHLSEVAGPLSSGRTRVALSALAAATREGEVAAYIDATDCLDPASAERAGVALERLLWVRCRPPARSRFEQVVLKRPKEDEAWQAVNLVAQAGGFGLIVLDLGGLGKKRLQIWQNRRWLRLQRAIEHTPTALLVLATDHVAGSSAVSLLHLRRAKTRWLGKPGVSLLLNGVRANARLGAATEGLLVEL